MTNRSSAGSGWRCSAPSPRTRSQRASRPPRLGGVGALRRRSQGAGASCTHLAQARYESFNDQSRNPTHQNAIVGNDTEWSPHIGQLIPSASDWFRGREHSLDETSRCGYPAQYEFSSRGHSRNHHVGDRRSRVVVELRGGTDRARHVGRRNRQCRLHDWPRDGHVCSRAGPQHCTPCRSDVYLRSRRLERATPAEWIARQSSSPATTGLSPVARHRRSEPVRA